MWKQILCGHQSLGEDLNSADSADGRGRERLQKFFFGNGYKNLGTVTKMDREILVRVFFIAANLLENTLNSYNLTLRKG